MTGKGTGAVVSSTTKYNIMVAGDPARFVKKLGFRPKQQKIRIMNCTTSLLVLVSNI